MADVVAALVAGLGPGSVRQGEAIGQRHRQDWSLQPPTLPKALLLPAGVAQVSLALRICHAHGQTVVPQGGMTGLAGGGHPGPDDVALSLERLVGVEQVDGDAATLTALAGTPLQLVQEAAEQAGFALGIDLGARGSCSIGGNVSTNAGGNNVLRYGMSRQNVRGLEVVLADGTVVSGLNKLMKNNAGYDWTQLFIGSEGTLGVVTRVVLALHPRTSGFRAAFCAVAGFAEAVRVLRRLEAALPGRLMAFEAMWRDYYAFATTAGGQAPPLPADAPLFLLIDAAMGDDPAALDDVLGTLLEDGLLQDAVIAQSEAERRKLWAIREVPAEFPRILPLYIGFDVGIPLARMADAVAAMRAVIARDFPHATALFYGHVADSNLHLVMGRPQGEPLPVLPVEEAIYPVVQQFGGTISAEHGVGTVKKPFLHLSRSPEELALMATIRRALDPTGILNPGKIF
jgi:FAD/FMN-containing dehydrogenase